MRKIISALVNKVPAQFSGYHSEELARKAFEFNLMNLDSRLESAKFLEQCAAYGQSIAKLLNEALEANDVESQKKCVKLLLRDTNIDYHGNVVPSTYWSVSSLNISQIQNKEHITRLESMAENFISESSNEAVKYDSLFSALSPQVGKTYRNKVLLNRQSQEKPDSVVDEIKRLIEVRQGLFKGDEYPELATILIDYADTQIHKLIKNIAPHLQERPQGEASTIVELFTHYPAIDGIKGLLDVVGEQYKEPFLTLHRNNLFNELIDDLRKGYRCYWSLRHFIEFVQSSFSSQTLSSEEISAITNALQETVLNIVKKPDDLIPATAITFS